MVVAASSVSAEVVEYNLTIAQSTVNFTGRSVPAMTVNGGIPGPTLRFNEGDTARIHVTNTMDVPTSIHWHGLLVPPDMDGVPFITYPPIAPGTTFTYEFPIRQSGTYWYHSHTSLQEQSGVYGSIAIEPRGGDPRYPGLKEHVVLLSDWTDEDPHEVMRTLRAGNEYYSLRKRSGQSILGALHTGHLKDYFARELQRMPAMDISDVAYDRYLVNGKTEENWPVQPGERVRLRIVDGSASTFFHIEFAGGPLTVIAADGQDVEPFDVDRLFIGVAETYDVLITVPADGRYELRATSHDRVGRASLWVGSGTEHPAPLIPAPDLYAGMGPLKAKKVFALTPAGTMGMPQDRVDAGDFDQPGMNMGDMKTDGMAMSGMEGMAASAKDDGSMPGMNKMSGMSRDDMTMPQQEPPRSTSMVSGTMNMPGDAMTQDSMPPTQHADMSGMGAESMGHPKVPVKEGLASSPIKPGVPMPAMISAPGAFEWLGGDLSSQGPLARDGSATRPWGPYAQLRSTHPTALDPAKPVREIRLTLDGDMERYVWFINNTPLSASDDILIKEGEVVRFIMINRTMMHHPMHLHGHFFRVLNGQGAYSPLKHTVDVEPMRTTVIEFDANEKGDWFFHCHLLYHMKAGMARVVEYEGFDPAPETAAVRAKLYADPYYRFGRGAFASNMTEGWAELSNSRNIFRGEWEIGWDNVPDVEWEGIASYGRYLNRFTTVFAGADFLGERSTLGETRGVAGISYTLPFNLHTRSWLDTDGGARFAFTREFMLTPRMALELEGQYDTHTFWEGVVALDYVLSKHTALQLRWHSDFKWGGGVRILF
ncbi:MAG: multicopper oxidase domain-containing protein [Opitutaceae bacterium]